MKGRLGRAEGLDPWRRVEKTPERPGVPLDRPRSFRDDLRKQCAIRDSNPEPADDRVRAMFKRSCRHCTTTVLLCRRSKGRVVHQAGSSCVGSPSGTRSSSVPATDGPISSGHGPSRSWMMSVMNLALISGIAALMAVAAGNSSMARLLGNRASNRQVTVVTTGSCPSRSSALSANRTTMVADMPPSLPAASRRAPGSNPVIVPATESRSPSRCNSARIRPPATNKSSSGPSRTLRPPPSWLSSRRRRTQLPGDDREVFPPLHPGSCCQP